MIEAPDTRYARSGTLSIAYQVVGEGSPDLLFVPGFVSNTELMWDVPWIAHDLERLGSIGRLVTFDKRGTGCSDRSLGSGSADERMDDVRAVADAAGVDRAIVVGLSEGGPLAILFATTYPERVRGLVLWDTFARLLAGPDYPIGYPEEVVDAFIEDAVAKWGTGHALRRFVNHLPDDPATDRLMARYERQTATPGVIGQILFHNTRMDVRDALAALRVPTLVIHRLGDRLIDIDHARAMAGLIEDVRLLELPGDWHVNGRVGADDDVFDAIEEFVVGDTTAQRRHVDRVLATVLFTDIVGSTSRAAAAGDRSWRALLEQHDDVARRHVERFGGTIVTRTGDGLLATFDGPGRAVRAAQAIVESVKPLGLDVRAGLHTCEIERRDRDVSGIGVHIGARIAALADANEVLVSNTVKDLVLGSDIEFSDRGSRALKGLAGEWRVWAAV